MKPVRASHTAGDFKRLNTDSTTLKQMVSQRVVKQATITSQNSKVQLEYNMMSPNVNDFKDPNLLSSNRHGASA